MLILTCILLEYISDYIILTLYVGLGRNIGDIMYNYILYIGNTVHTVTRFTHKYLYNFIEQ